MRIRIVKVEAFDSVQGIGADDTLDISRHYASDIALAVESDHWCEDSHYDISHALRAGAPLVAAGLLSGATECAHVDAVIWAHAFNGTLPHDPRQDVYASPDWGVWRQYHDEHGRECASCGAFDYDDSSACANCGATLADDSEGEHHV
jgi:hypothetical protein